MAEATLAEIETLLADADRVLQHQEELKRLKGEHFNIFSILQMESKENATHSAFLGELLNPQGSHLLGSCLLKYWLDEISYEGALDINKARVELEKHIGTIDLKNKTGGRIDIFIYDKSGNSISIENKIYAGDQEAQVERYVNHQTVRNTMYYLTLDGAEPSDTSRGSLKSGEDYHCISYRENVIAWLEKCIKEAADQPMLRESIKQYLLLIKKLTHQLTDHQMQEQIHELIKSKLQAAKVVADNVWRVELGIAELFLAELEEKLKLQLGADYTIEVDQDLTKPWTGLKIGHNNWNGILVKLEGSPKVPWFDSIYGIIAHTNDYLREDFTTHFKDVDWLQSGYRNSKHWPFYDTILNFGKVEVRESIFNDNYRKDQVDKAAKKLIELVEVCKTRLPKIRKFKKTD